MIHCDYMCLIDRGLFKKTEVTEEEKAEALTVLVIYDSHSRGLFAHAVPCKGAGLDNYAADRICAEIAWLGYPRVILRSDNETSLVQVVTNALKILRVQLVGAIDISEGQPSAAAEGSTPYDPQTNGAIERSVGLIKGQVKAMRMTLEQFLKAKVPVRHPIMWWLVRHASRVRLLRSRGADGTTAYQRVRGVEARVKLAHFGELCRYKCRSQEQGVAGTEYT